MKTPLPTLTLLSALLLPIWPSQAQTQTPPPDTTVLEGKDVNTDRLIEVLTPPPPKMRTLRVDREQNKPAAARRPSASLLITFHTASTELTPAARQQLDTLAEALKSDRLLTYQFELEGHADRRGSAQNNLSLSQGRAESVRDYLVKVHGIAPERLMPVGKGDSEPLNPNQVSAPENRRVTIITRTPAP
ncbi:MAG TPA: OmpA family protein [Burkholderiaceae bacterium]|nr:OmpA family protein [Burkholderiaceae bacterium]HNB45287.1 OmpA family protein [Burkholderiaceae bacterium]HNG78008.1 OmpA family protein [Burkholderiaceae bacterium]